MNELNKYVEQGTGPIFGFPPICYSPPAEFALHRVNKNEETVKTLIRHIFLKNSNYPSVAEIIDAKRANDKLIQNMQLRKMQNSTQKEKYGHP